MMNWLPTPSDFRRDLRTAREIPRLADRFEKLARLAEHRLGYLETLQLDRVLRDQGHESIPGFSLLRLAIISSSTVDHLAPAIRVAGLRRRLLINVHVGGYGLYRQEILDHASRLHKFDPHVVLLSLTAREVCNSVSLTATAEEVDETVTRSVDDLRLLWRRARETLKATIIQQNLLNVTNSVFGSYDRLVPGAPARVVARLNDRLAAAAASDLVLLLDIAGASEHDGRDAWFDNARWLQGKLEIAPQAAPQYGELLVRILAAQRGLSKKCLVLDLDNTLWGGVVGDDGIDGIVLGEGSAAGEAYLALQRYAKQLNERGVILAVCSKNDPATAQAVFRDHPEMILRRPDIAAFVANWEDKAGNLRTIAAQLNIGLDSLVFVDDNPVERARIREDLPMVAVPELPEDPAHYVRCLADAGYFEAVSFTVEDRQRAEQYAANTRRDEFLESSGSVEDFLRRLEMSTLCGPFAAVDLPRVTQLINKTNQFNPTTKRYSGEEVKRLASAPENVTLQFRLVDKFGDNGLVSAMILCPNADTPDVLEIECWVMSCRVFGRQLEFEAMNTAVAEALRRGARAFRASYIPNKQNAVIRELYPSLGFTQVHETGSFNGMTRWILSLSAYVPRRTHIVLTEGV
jgi:FkbH-like protein